MLVAFIPPRFFLFTSFRCPLWPCCQSFTGFLLGDLVAQAPEISSGGKWDAWRTAKMGSFGLLLHGPIGHYWYGFLDRTVMTKAPTSALAVASKTGIDQILWAPIFTSGFFAYMKTADGKASEIPEEVQSKLWDTMKVNWMTWIPGTWPSSFFFWLAGVRAQQRFQLVLTPRISRALGGCDGLGKGWPSFDVVGPVAAVPLAWVPVVMTWCFCCLWSPET